MQQNRKVCLRDRAKGRTCSFHRNLFCLKAVRVWYSTSTLVVWRTVKSEYVKNNFDLIGKNIKHLHFIIINLNKSQINNILLSTTARFYTVRPVGLCYFKCQQLIKSPVLLKFCASASPQRWRSSDVMCTWSHIIWGHAEARNVALDTPTFWRSDVFLETQSRLKCWLNKGFHLVVSPHNPDTHRIWEIVVTCKEQPVHVCDSLNVAEGLLATSPTSFSNYVPLCFWNMFCSCSSVL